LEKALQAIQAHVSGEIWCVFGCGGDRDQGKRSQMGHIAAQYAQHVIITNDNPRHESPEVIAEHIIAGIKPTKRVQLILDREAAIRYAIKHASEKDVILVAGKGHENYQQVGDEKMPFSDQAVVNAVLSETVIK
jgi:UDP-N-acetylmuramoyl-L-alanyl-D-glutamate--2,6-diaminopimelate ligase